MPAGSASALDNLLRLTVADGPAHSAHAVVRFRHEQAPLARELAALFNTRVSEDDWLLVVPTRELDLALAIQPLAIRLAPAADEVEAAIKAPLPVIEPLAGDEAPDVLHSIVLAALGLERRVALFEQMRNDPVLAPALKRDRRSGEGIAVGNFGAAAGGSARARPAQGTAAQSPEGSWSIIQTKEPAGTIVIDTPNTYLYLVLGHGKAMRYGIGVGREGFTWSGTERISKMKEWPDWYPPAEMIERQPYLPRMMAGGPGNPLGARALYLGHTLYRIHGTNQPSTIGSFVSSGCIRLLNEDIEDLFSRVQVGTRVVGACPARRRRRWPITGAPTAGAVLNMGPANPTAAPSRNGTAANTGSTLNVEPASPMAPPSGNGTAISSSPLPPVR